MFIPTWMIQKIELKWTMVISQICQSTYIAAQFYPTFYTLIPTAILLGLASAPLVLRMTKIRHFALCISRSIYWFQSTKDQFYNERNLKNWYEILKAIQRITSQT